MLEELVLLDAARLETRGETGKEAAQGQWRGGGEARVAGAPPRRAENGVAIRQLSLAENDLRLLRDVAPLTLKPVIAVPNIADDAAAAPDAAIPGLAAQACAAAGVEALGMPARPKRSWPGWRRTRRRSSWPSSAWPSRACCASSARPTARWAAYVHRQRQGGRSWSLRGGSTAQQAAGSIHSDLARGFIRAETVAYGDFCLRRRGKKAARASRKARDYAVQDGDILHIRFGGRRDAPRRPRTGKPVPTGNTRLAPPADPQSAPRQFIPQRICSGIRARHIRITRGGRGWPGWQAHAGGELAALLLRRRPLSARAGWPPARRSQELARKAAR